MAVELEVPCRKCKFFDGVSKLGKWYHCEKFDRWMHSTQFFEDNDQLAQIFNCLEEEGDVIRLNVLDLRKAGFEMSPGDKFFWAKGSLLKSLKQERDI